MLEIVIAGRHDDYSGADFVDRLCAAAEHNHGLLAAAAVQHRFILVEWNPVPGRPLLADLVQDRLPWWHRVLIVDRQWHQALSTNPRLQFMEFFAKNSAVRRSAADAVLTTNSDVFFSSELVKTLARTTFHDRVIYRAMRIDVSRTVNWRRATERALADPSFRIRVIELKPPCYSHSAGDFLLMTRRGWLARGGFNERVRFAKVHKDGQFCINAHLDGYAFESLGPIYHIDHDASYTNAGTMLGSPDAPYGPEWDYRQRYRNPVSWGLTPAVDEPSINGRVYAHHPSSHGPLLSVVVPPQPAELRQRPDGSHNLAAAVNAAMATATGRFVIVTSDASLDVFGGPDILHAVLKQTTAGLIVPPGSLVQHPVVGPVPASGAPYVMRRNVIDAFTEWDEAEADPAMAFWLRAAEVTTIEAVPPAAGATPRVSSLVPVIDSGLQMAAVMRRGHTMPRALLEQILAEHIAATHKVQDALRQWVGSVAADAEALCAVVGPDWATAALIEVLESENRPFAGVFTSNAAEAGSWRWGHKLRPIDELAYTDAAHIFAGADVGVAGQVVELGCHGAVHVIAEAGNASLTTADAELDALRRAQARDLAADRISAVQARLPLLATLDPERAWTHRYDAAQACERAKLPAAALELYREVTEECTNDAALARRAAFHTARLLVERGALHQAAPLLAKILKHNPAHQAARQLFDQVTNQRLSA